MEKITFAPIYHGLVWENTANNRIFFKYWLTIYVTFLCFLHFLLFCFSSFQILFVIYCWKSVERKIELLYSFIVCGCGDLAIEDVEFFCPKWGLGIICEYYYLMFIIFLFIDILLNTFLFSSFKVSNQLCEVQLLPLYGWGNWISEVK